MAEKERGALKEEKKKEGAGGKRNLHVKEIGGIKFHYCELMRGAGRWDKAIDGELEGEFFGVPIVGRQNFLWCLARQKILACQHDRKILACHDWHARKLKNIYIIFLILKI